MTEVKQGTVGAAMLLALSAAAAQGTPVLAPEALFERLAPSVWTVQTFDAQGKVVASGSAVVIGAGRLVTNCHVIAKAKKVGITHENVTYGATLAEADSERDLCVLNVRNFNAPAVTVASADEMRIGSRVYAIGSPFGLEQTISDGLLSGVRKTDDGGFIALQITVPISPGSSGGGLFDDHGRLIGITTFQLRNGQNLNFAVPASWILELPQRATTAHAPTLAASNRGQVFEYELRDRITGLVRKVEYRLERTDGEKSYFNQGSRVETTGGAVLSMSSPIAGEFDIAMPPGGWIAKEPKPGESWDVSYRPQDRAPVVSMSLHAQVQGDTAFKLKDRELRVVQVLFSGYTERFPSINANAPGAYEARVLYSPELGRIVRFEATTRGGTAGYKFLVDEQLELVDIRAE